MRDSVTFVHTADLHLDAPFSGISADDPRVGRELGDATYQAFGRVVDTCLERAVDFLVIAGDAYNSADKSLRAQLRFKAEMERLAEAGIEVFVAHGNHDPVSGWSAGLPLPETVHVFPADRVARHEVVRDGEVVAAVYGRSFGCAAETDNLALDYRREGDEPAAVGVLHANVGGDPDYDPYAPASLADLRAAGFDYWALGHIHKQEILLPSDPCVAYSGSPQGLNPKEIGAHGCLVVELSRRGAVTVTPVETAPVAWAQLDVDLAEAGSLDDIRGLVVDACERARGDASRPCVARLRLLGRSDAHADLTRPGVLGDLTADLRAEQVTRTPWLWLDRLEDETSPAIDLAAVRSGVDFAAELVSVADDVEGDAAQLEALVSDLARPVATTLPSYHPGLTDAELLVRARDAALDLLLVEHGGDQ